MAASIGRNALAWPFFGYSSGTTFVPLRGLGAPKGPEPWPSRCGSEPRELVMPQNEGEMPEPPPSAAELRARAARYRELARQYYAADVVDRMLELAAELEERATAMENAAKSDGADQ